MKCIVRKHVFPCCKSKWKEDTVISFTFNLTFHSERGMSDYSHLPWAGESLPQHRNALTPREGCSRCLTADSTTVRMQTLLPGEILCWWGCRVKAKTKPKFFVLKKNWIQILLTLFSLQLNISMVKCRPLITDLLIYLFLNSHRLIPPLLSEHYTVFPLTKEKQHALKLRAKLNQVLKSEQCGSKANQRPCHWKGDPAASLTCIYFCFLSCFICLLLYLLLKYLLTPFHAEAAQILFLALNHVVGMSAYPLQVRYLVR